MTGIVEVLGQRGHTLKKKTAGEQATSCPFCGGIDRFCVWPDQDRYWCRQCERKGDVIQLLRDLDGMSFKDAAIAAGREDKIKDVSNNQDTPSKKPVNQKRKVVCTYDYRDESGNLLFQVCRTDPKGFFQRRPDGKGGWINNLKGITPVLYRLSDVINADEVIIVEGEKDADKLVEYNYTATTAPMGAGKWLDSYTEALKGKHVVLIPDNDDQGRKYMARVAAAINGQAASIKLLNIPDLPNKGDISDFISQFKDQDEAGERLSVMIDQAEPYKPPILEDEMIHAVINAARISSIIDKTNGEIQKNRQTGSIGKKTGLRIIDNLIYGLIKSFLYAIGGYTSTGKTAMMIQLIVNILYHDQTAKLAVFSLEMTRIQILLRIISSWTSVPSLEIYQGKLGREQHELVSNAFQQFRKTNIYIFDDVKRLDRMEDICRQLSPLDGIFIDFAQLIHERGGSIYERMSTVSLKLQDMAKELDTAVVALSQIDNESVRNPSEVIGFKGGGELAAASDFAMWLTRDKKDETLMNCIVRKNRHGKKGRAVFKYINNWTSLEER